MNTPNLTNRPHVFHLRDGRRTWFVVADRTHTVRGAVGETEAEVKARWLDAHGAPAGGFVRITGYCRPSEAAMTLADLVRQGDRAELPEGGAR